MEAKAFGSLKRRDLQLPRLLETKPIASQLSAAQTWRPNIQKVVNATTKAELKQSSPDPDFDVKIVGDGVSEVKPEEWHVRPVKKLFSPSRLGRGKEPFSPSRVHPINPFHIAGETTSISCPVTEPRLIDEVKDIYAGLVMVEKKCIEIVSQYSSRANLLLPSIVKIVGDEVLEVNPEEWHVRPVKKSLPPSRPGRVTKSLPPSRLGRGKEPFSPSRVHPINPFHIAGETTSTSYPVTEPQLIDKVKIIYAGLAKVEKKCAEIVSQQNESSKRLSDQQWKALVALHRTLLQEHHDFFSASQHPTASTALKELTMRYSMPARMWRHGIHAFLELLRHRLPDCLDYMLSCIRSSYSVVRLLRESVPDFNDTLIECLGDLARYRMAIEDSDPRDRETWSKEARMWYNEAADKIPNVGRTWYRPSVLVQLDILEQPSGYKLPADPFEESLFQCPSINGWRRYGGRSKSWKPSLYVRLMVARYKIWHNAHYITRFRLLPIPPQSPHHVARLMLPFNKKACFRWRSGKNARKPSMRKLLESGLEDVLNEYDGCGDASLELVAQTETHLNDWRDFLSSHSSRSLSLIKCNCTSACQPRSFHDINLVHESFTGTMVASAYRLSRTIRREKHFALYHVTHLITDEPCLLTSIIVCGIPEKERKYRIKLLKRLQNRIDHMMTHFNHGTAWIVQNYVSEHGKRVTTRSEDAGPSVNSKAMAIESSQTSSFLRRGTKKFEEHFPPTLNEQPGIWPAKVTWPTIGSRSTSEKQQRKRIAQRDRRFRKRQARRDGKNQEFEEAPPDKQALSDSKYAPQTLNDALNHDAPPAKVPKFSQAREILLRKMLVADSLDGLLERSPMSSRLEECLDAHSASGIYSSQLDLFEE